MALDLEQQIINNLKFFFDLRALNAGLYFNVASGQPDFAGNDQSALIRVFRDPDFDDGRVYQSKYKNWVYEEDVVPPSGFALPTIASGVFVNGVFRLRTDFTFGHSIDYPNGRIIFDDDSAVTVTDTVQAKFSVKRVQIEEINKDIIPLINDLIISNPSIESPQAVPSGLALPAIFIERVRGSSAGLQLGGGKITTRELNFHILARHSNDLKHISFLLSELEDRALKMVDWDNAPFPLDDVGDVTTTYIPFSGLQDSFFLNGLYFVRMEPRTFPTDIPIEIEIVEAELQIRRRNA